MMQPCMFKERTGKPQEGERGGLMYHVISHPLFFTEACKEVENFLIF